MSGIIYVTDPSRFLKNIDSEALDLIIFNESVEFDVGFFADPATYRYVDGRNNFYIVDNWRKVVGLIKIRNPEKYSFLSRAIFTHLENILQIRYGRLVVAFVGRNDDVNIVTRRRLHFRGQKMAWSVVDRTLLEAQIRFTSDRNRNDLISIIYAISDLRFGSLILIAKEATKLPVFAGQISSSSISVALQNAIVGSNISELVSNNSAIGVFSSDGLNAFGEDGHCLCTGKIIDLAAGESVTITGGGRTQAARAASLYGLAIKISEDGPITIFSDGREVIRFSR